MLILTCLALHCSILYRVVNIGMFWSVLVIQRKLTVMVGRWWCGAQWQHPPTVAVCTGDSIIAAWSHPDTMQPARVLLLTSLLAAASSSGEEDPGIQMGSPASSGEEDPGILMGSPASSGEEAEYEDWWPRPSVHHSLLLHLVNVHHNCSLKEWKCSLIYWK